MKPSKLKVLGKEYKVTYVPKIADVNTITPNDTLFGQIEYIPSSIRIFGGLGEYDNLQTILHEVIHAIGVALAIGIDERQTDLLATGMANVLIDNDMLKKNGKSS